jgi:protein-tyrosine phosphatase
LPTPGRLGLSRTPGSSGRPRDEDLDAFVQAGVRHVVCLQEPHEFERLHETLDERREAVLARGMAFTHEPIADMDAPAPRRLAGIVDDVLALLADDGGVIVHCWAGLGRAGTIAACVLVTQGMSAQMAVARLRAMRPGVVQSVVQERLIRHFAEQRAAGASG